MYAFHRILEDHLKELAEAAKENKKVREEAVKYKENKKPTK